MRVPNRSVPQNSSSPLKPQTDKSLFTPSPMATIFRLRRNTTDASNTGSGGKIMRARRIPDARSPYARPPPPPPPPTPASPAENPSRLLGLISPASRIITGAAKMVSSVFFPDTPPDSSSSEDENDDDDMSSPGDGRLNQNEATPEANIDVETVQKNVRMLAIEQLLMQETLSRDEFNKLVKIIESRVVDFPARTEAGDARRGVLTDKVLGTGDTLPGASQSNWQSRKSPTTYSYLGNSFNSPRPRAPSVGGHDPDACNTAVLEAKKWVEEKKTELYSQKDKSPGTFISNSCMLSNITEGELGSPVLMAKSYMKSRPPWATPTASHSISQTSPIGRYLLKEESPYSIGAHTLSSSKEEQRNILAIESCNILDGSRRGRVEDSVQPLTAHSNTQEDAKTFVEADKKDEELGSRIPHSDSLPLPESVKQSKHFPEVLAKNNGFSVHDAPEHEASSTSPAILTNEHIKDLEGAQIIVEGGNTTHDDSPPQEDQAKQKERNGLTDRVVTNDFLSASSLSAKVNPSVSNKEGKNVASSSDGNWEGSCELLSETFVRVPNNNEIITTNASIGISSPEPVLIQSPSVSSPDMKRRSSPRVKKAVKYSRRGRGRGRGKDV